MTTEEEYHILLPKTPILFTETNVTFSINKIKSRELSVLYFKFYCYDKDNTTIYTYTSPRWIIDTEYRRRARTFTLPSDVVENTVYTQFELVAIGNSSENPLYFTELMFNEGEDIGYYEPFTELGDKTDGLKVGLYNSRYVNLYNTDGNFMQVIRPTGDPITTHKLLHSTCTVIAPHFADETDIDNPINVFLEFINQTEQRIDVLR